MDLLDLELKIRKGGVTPRKFPISLDSKIVIKSASVRPAAHGASAVSILAVSLFPRSHLLGSILGNPTAQITAQRDPSPHKFHSRVGSLASATDKQRQQKKQQADVDWPPRLNTIALASASTPGYGRATRSLARILEGRRPSAPSFSIAKKQSSSRF